MRLLLILLGASLLIFSCDDNDESEPIAPVVASFAPTSGLPGASVTISGSNFVALSAGNIVKFGDIPAVVTSATETQLVVTVPTTASTGKIRVTSNGMTATSSTDFTVESGVSIVNFTPSSGIIGSTVTIMGTNFSTTTFENIVRFNGVTSVVFAATATQLTVNVPPGAATGKITVTTNEQTVTTPTDFTVLAPAITSFTPASGVAGTSVIIEGTNFSAVTGQNSVKFNGIEAVITSGTATQLTAFVPAEATTGKITVMVNGEPAQSAADFTILAPTIQSYTPQIAAAGITVVITGTNFSTIASNNIVKFNGVAATVSAATSTKLTVIVPQGATTGALSVKVGPNTASSANNFSICTGSAEFIISDVALVNQSGATSYTVTFRVTNVGSVAADLSEMGMQNYAVTDQSGATGVAASGYSFNEAGILDPGESYVTPNYSCNIVGGNTTTHPYLKITVHGPLTECNTDNNIAIRHFGL